MGVEGEMNVSECRQSKRAQQRRKPETRTRRRRRTGELLKITSQSCVSYLWSVHRPAAGEEIPPSAGTHSRSHIHLKTTTIVWSNNLSYTAKSSPVSSGAHGVGAKLTFTPRPKLSDCEVFHSVRRRFFDVSPPHPPAPPPSPTLAQSERSAERPKRRDQKEVRGFRSASVFFQKITKPLNPAGQLNR